MLILRLIALLAFLFIPGYLATSLFVREGSRIDGAETLFLSAVLGCGLTALLGMTLGLAGIFSLTAMLVAQAALSAALAVAAWRLSRFARISWSSWAVLALLAVLGLALFLPPSRVAFGWSDEGSYPDIAARMALEGEIHTRMAVVTEVAPERRDMVFFPNDDSRYAYQANLYKQYYITDYQAGEVVPQFYYVWPSLMAVFGLFLGVDDMFYAMTLVAVLSLWGMFLLARRMNGKRWVWAAVLLASLSPLMIYFSKYATSETLTLALFLGAGLALLDYQEEEGAGAAVGAAALAGLFFAISFFTRIDFYLVLPPLLVVMFWRRMEGEWKTPDSVFAVVLLLGFALAMVVGRLASAPYFTTIFSYSMSGSRGTAALLLAALGVTGAVLFFLPRYLRGPAAWLRRWDRQWRILVWLALAGAFVFFYFVRPAMPSGSTWYGGLNAASGPSYDHENLLRWGWYFSLPGLLLIFTGYGLAVTGERKKSWSPLLAAGISLTFFYMWNMRCNPLHILVMRRLIPVIFPMAVVMAAYALKRLWHWTPPGKGPSWLRLLRPLAMIFSALLLIYLAAFSISASWPIFGLSEGGNQREAVEAVHEAASDGIVLLDYNAGDLFGPPLFAFHDQPNAWLTSKTVQADERFGDLLSDLSFPERPVYLLWRPALSGEAVGLAEGFELEKVAEVVWHEESLEVSYEHRPDHHSVIDEAFILYRIVPVVHAPAE